MAEMEEQQPLKPRRNHPPHHHQQQQQQQHRTPRNPPNRIYNSLGVNDLRELLDRKRRERGDSGEGPAPPPDPSYNYLKDPLRESEGNDSRKPRKQHQRNQRPDGSSRDQYRGQGGSRGRGSRSKPTHDIENPSNIKIEFSTSTGEHTYTLDKGNTLPTIKHVPDKQHKTHHSRGERGGRSGGWRGRGRGQYRGHNHHPNSSPRHQENPPVQSEETWDDTCQAQEESAQFDHRNDQVETQNTEFDQMEPQNHENDEMEPHNHENDQVEPLNPGNDEVEVKKDESEQLAEAVSDLTINKDTKKEE